MVHRDAAHRRHSPHLAVGTGIVATLASALLSVSSVSAAGVGSITEFDIPTTGSEPNGIVAGSDGNVWFTEYGASKIGRITPSGSITEFVVPTANSGARNITAGANGNLWFTEYNSDKIGEITPTGVFTEFLVPTAAAGPRGITTGPDGNIWFTEYNADKIGVLDPSEAVAGTDDGISEYTVPTANAGPRDISPGPNGNLWFTEYTGAQIGEITTSGTITEFPTPTSGSGPAKITVGPNGNLWFTENNVAQIAQVDPSDVVGGTDDGITEYLTPTVGSQPVGIAPGPDGNVWFTENLGDSIGVLDPSDVVAGTDDGITEYLVPTAGSVPQNIFQGYNGELWFTEQTGDKIGEITTATAVDVISLDDGFVPAALTASHGSTVTWIFLGGEKHSVADSTKLDLFNSGSLAGGTTFQHTFTGAATYSYKDTVGGLKGSVAVPLTISPTTGTPTTVFTVTWASAAPPAGLGENVYVKVPKSTAYTLWQADVTTLSANYTPTKGKGTYDFRADVTNGTHTTGYTPVVAIKVT